MSDNRPNDWPEPGQNLEDSQADWSGSTKLEWPTAEQANKYDQSESSPESLETSLTKAQLTADAPSARESYRPESAQSSRTTRPTLLKRLYQYVTLFFLYLVRLLIWLIMGLVFIVILFYTAQFDSQSGDSQPGDSQPYEAVPATTQVGTIGSTLSFHDYSILVNQVEKADSYQDPVSAEVTEADPGNQFVFVNITYTDGGLLDTSMSIRELRLMDNQGIVYELPLLNKDLRKPALRDYNFTGFKVQGWLTFEIPKTAQGLLLNLDHVDYLDHNSDIHVRIKLDNQANLTPPLLPQDVGNKGTIGQVVSNGRMLLMVNSVSTREYLQDEFGNSKKAPAGNKFIAINLTVTGASDDEVSFEPEISVLKDQNNTSYEQDTSIYPSELLQFGNLLKGYREQFLLYFKVPSESQGLRLEYQDIISSMLTVNLKN